MPDSSLFYFREHKKVGSCTTLKKMMMPWVTYTTVYNFTLKVGALNRIIDRER